MDHVELRTADLLLRPWREADAVDVLAAFADPDIARWNPPPADLDLAAAQHWARSRGDWSSGTQAAFAVTDPADTTLLGSVSLHSIHGDGAGIGYWTVPVARGRGVASTAVRLVTEWAFRSLALHRIELCHAVENLASCRVAERVGYRWEGTLRESYRYGDGRRHDEHLHARLATDG